MGFFPWIAGQKLNAADLNSMFKFGGDGSDGAKTVSSSESLDMGAERMLLKNYTSLTVNASQILDVTNKHADGAILYIKVQGDCTINGTIDLDSAGGSGGAAATNDYQSQDRRGPPGPRYGGVGGAHA